MSKKISKAGFTMVELIVVVAMIMLLAGAVTSSVHGALKRAKIQQATVETEEMTKAILAYENVGKDFSLDAHLMEGQVASEKTLSFILGTEQSQVEGDQSNVGVLYNAAVSANGEIRDPWGNPYYVTIKKRSLNVEEEDRMNFKSAVTIPNFNRRAADELLP